MGIRVSEATYGVIRPRRYKADHHELRTRKALRSLDAEGKEILMGCFFQIVPLVSNLPPSSIILE